VKVLTLLNIHTSHTAFAAGQVESYWHDRLPNGNQECKPASRLGNTDAGYSMTAKKPFFDTIVGNGLNIGFEHYWNAENTRYSGMDLQAVHFYRNGKRDGGADFTPFMYVTLKNTNATSEVKANQHQLIYQILWNSKPAELYWLTNVGVCSVYIKNPPAGLRVDYVNVWKNV
jgi:hypothetical protein